MRVTAVRDITRRKQIEEELRTHRNHLAQLVEERTVELIKERDMTQQYLNVAAVMMMVLNPQGNITLLNKKGPQVFQVARAAIDYVVMIADYTTDFIEMLR